MAKINVRSPYYIPITAVNLTSCLLELYIYTGEQTTDRGTVKYTLNTTAYDEEVTFEISELVRDYLDTTFNGTYTSHTVWVDYQTTTYVNDVLDTVSAFIPLVGYEGYGYFEDGANPDLDNDGKLQSNEIIISASGEEVTVAADQSIMKAIKWYVGGGIVHTDTITETSESDDNIRYLSYTGADIVEYDWQGATLQIPITYVEECKHTPYKLTFVNRFGALQDLWFFKRTNLALETSKNDYKGNILNSGTYSTSEHQNKILNKQGKEKLILNSGFVPEEYNEVFRQLMLSEKVWIEVSGDTLPVNVSSAGLPFKDSLNDKLINYTINVDYAFDKINSVR